MLCSFRLWALTTRRRRRISTPRNSFVSLCATSAEPPTALPTLVDPRVPTRGRDGEEVADRDATCASLLKGKETCKIELTPFPWSESVVEESPPQSTAAATGAAGDADAVQRVLGALHGGTPIHAAIAYEVHPLCRMMLVR